MSGPLPRCPGWWQELFTQDFVGWLSCQLQLGSAGARRVLSRHACAGGDDNTRRALLPQARGWSGGRPSWAQRLYRCVHAIPGGRTDHPRCGTGDALGLSSLPCILPQRWQRSSQKAIAGSFLKRRGVGSRGRVPGSEELLVML